MNKCINSFKDDLILQGVFNYDEKLIISIFQPMTVFELKNWIKIDEKLKRLQFNFKNNLKI